MSEQQSEAMQTWDSLTVGLRHPKNLAILAVEHLALPDDHPCTVTVLQDIDGPAVAVLVELTGDDERVIKVLDGDDPVSLAARIRVAADELVDDFSDVGWHGEHFFDEPHEDMVRRLDEMTARVRVERLRRIRETVRKEYAAGTGRVPSADEIVEVVREVEAELLPTWYKPGHAPLRGEER